MMDRGTPLYLGSAATVLVTSLLERNGAGDPLIAHRTVERLAALPADWGRVYLELPILHLSALVSQHRGDEAAYRDFADRYRTSSTAVGFDAHTAIARAMR
jgi:adenylate cyclase